MTGQVWSTWVSGGRAHGHEHRVDAPEVGRQFAIEGTLVSGTGTLVAYGDAGMGGVQKVDEALDELTCSSTSSVTVDLSGAVGVDASLLEIVARHKSAGTRLLVLLPPVDVPSGGEHAT